VSVGRRYGCLHLIVHSGWPRHKRPQHHGDQGGHRAAYRDDGIAIDLSAKKALWIHEDRWSMEEISILNEKLFSVSSLLHAAHDKKF
jgi:hypothetical protein